MDQVFFEVLQDKQRGAVFKLLHDLGWVGPLRRPNERVEMFRHEDVSHDFECQLPPQVSQSQNPLISKALAIKSVN
jgi:hypothetical protein